MEPQRDASIAFKDEAEPVMLNISLPLLKICYSG